MQSPATRRFHHQHRDHQRQRRRRHEPSPARSATVPAVAARSAPTVNTTAGTTTFSGTNTYTGATTLMLATSASLAPSAVRRQHGHRQRRRRSTKAVPASSRELLLFSVTGGTTNLAGINTYSGGLQQHRHAEHQQHDGPRRDCQHVRHQRRHVRQSRTQSAC